MERPIRVLLQTTIPTTKDDWSIERFSLLRDYLASLKNEAGNSLCEVTARNREADAENARVIAVGKSLVTNRPFNLVVAFESRKDAHGNTLGRAIAESSFHHFLDYNWDIEMGCPSFVEEPPGDGMKKEPRALEDIKTYVRNVALWLAPSTPV